MEQTDNKPMQLIQSLADKMSVTSGHNRLPGRLKHLEPKVAALKNRYPDLDAFMVSMNPSAQQYCAEHTDRVFNGNAPSMVVMDTAYGKDAATRWMLPQLLNLALYCGVKEKLDVEQATELARIIRTEFGYLNAAELMLFFYRFKSGRYGRFYGAVDPLEIMIALREHFIPERNQKISELENRAEAKRAEEHRKDVITYEEYVRRVQQADTKRKSNTNKQQTMNNEKN